MNTHKHYCRHCGAVIEHGDDCEYDTDHDVGLCAEDGKIRRAANKRCTAAWDRGEDADPEDLRLSQI